MTDESSTEVENPAEAPVDPTNSESAHGQQENAVAEESGEAGKDEKISGTGEESIQETDRSRDTENPKVERSHTKTGKSGPTTEKRKTAKKKVYFKVDQDVVYPLQGVGKITEQIKRKFKDEQVEYYTIYIAATDMTVMLPVAKVQELGLRPIVPKGDAEQALKSMSNKNEPLTSDWKLRYQNNLDLLKEGGVMDIATVVRSLYHRSKVKELPILERKLYDNALKLMIDEISLALDRPKEEVEDLLHTRLENSNN